MVDLFNCIFGILFWPKCFLSLSFVFLKYFSKVFSWVDRCARQESCHSSQLIDLFMVETNTDHTLFYMITKLYKEYPCIFGIQFMLDNVEAFFAGDQPQQHCVTPFFWEMQLLCICLELFIGLEFSCRPISASFLIRISGKKISQSSWLD